MHNVKVKPGTIISLGICVLAVWWRSVYYGNLRLSIATNDTQSYISSSKSPLFSWESFSGQRLFTTNLVYKLANDEGKCKVLVISQPAAKQEGFRKIQPCFDNIALLQNFLNMASWCILAWVTARWLRTPFLKILSVAIILAFGFTPQIAEWDSILGSESFSLSLFSITFALLQETVFRITSGQEKHFIPINRFFIPMWLFVFSLWVFIRDVHLYSIAVTLALSAPFLFVNKIRERLTVLPTILILAALLILGSTSSRHSLRWQTPLDDNLDGYIFPHPARVAYFTKSGMPESRSGDLYRAWFNTQALRTYGKFLATHPGFVMTTLVEKSDYFKSDFFQPYFKTPKANYRDTLLTIGEIIHPETNAIYSIDTLILITLCATAMKYRSKLALGRAWLAAWMYGYSGLSLFISFFADTNGVHRHIFPSVEMFRLFMWVFLFHVLDLQGETNKISSEYNDEQGPKI
jgi:hypothetical protein